MTIFSVLIFLVGLAVVVPACKAEARAGGSLLAPALLYVWHVAFSIYYWHFSKNAVVDATAYFYDAAQQLRFSMGTQLIYWLTGLFRRVLPEASFGDFFILYGVIGYSGIILFLRNMSLLAGEQYRGFLWLVYFIVFMPGLNIWTTAIGKEPLIFFSIQLAAFGVLRPRRFGTLLIGLAITFAIRPHIALVLAASLGLGMLMASRRSVAVRLIGAGGIGVAGAIAFPFVTDYLNLSSLDIESVSYYVSVNQNNFAVGGSAVDLSSYSFPMQVITYLFRPMLWEATSMVMIAAAFENIVYIVAFALFAFLSARYWRLITRSAFMTFAVFFFAVGISASAVVTANLGMAVRQKEQFLPFMFMVLVATLAHARRVGAVRRGEAEPSPAPTLSPPARSYRGL